MTRRLFQSLSVIAYYKLMQNIERRARGSYTVVKPVIEIEEFEMVETKPVLRIERGEYKKPKKFTRKQRTL